MADSINDLVQRACENIDLNDDGGGRIQIGGHVVRDGDGEYLDTDGDFGTFDPDYIAVYETRDEALSVEANGDEVSVGDHEGYAVQTLSMTLEIGA